MFFLFTTGTLDIPIPKLLPNFPKSIPFHFIADEAFPLSMFMMRPFPGRSQDNDKRIFNYRLSRARRCIENAFGIMSARFRIFRRPIPASPKNVEKIVLGKQKILLRFKVEILKVMLTYCAQ